MNPAAESLPLQETPTVPSLPLIGSVPLMAKDPARFFVNCYRKYGPVFRVRLLGKTYTVIAGVEAATFMGTREGKESLRSKEFWQGLVDEYGATRVLTGEDGEGHKELRNIMRHGYSKESIRGRYEELVTITDGSIDRDVVVAALKQQGVGSSVHYPRAVPLMAYYREKYGYTNGQFPVAEWLADQTISLPVGPHLQNDDPEYIGAALVRAVRDNLGSAAAAQ